MKEQHITKTLPYSLLTSMYSSWQEYKVPAIYYHYLLSVLPKLQKKVQLLLMAKQVKSLKANSHPYHKILNSISARERSLQAIQNNLSVFLEYESTEQMQWPQDSMNSNTIDFEFDLQNKNSENRNLRNSNGYKVTHEDPRSPILSPLTQSTKPKQKQARIQELMNHIRLYQRVTLQIIYMIAEWQGELKQLGYRESVITFHYHKQDYLQIVNRDTSDILDKYQSLFENNPFLILKKYHQKSEYALVYKQLKPSPSTQQKMLECLDIIASHEAQILRFRMLAKVSQTSNKRKYISKSTDIDKIYNNYNNGKDYIIIRDTQAMKRSKIIQQPKLSRIDNKPNNLISDQQLIKMSIEQKNNKLKSIKNSIIINPQARLLTIDKTIRKHPVQTNLDHLVNSNYKNDQIYLKDPYNRKEIKPYSPNLTPRKNKSQQNNLPQNKNISLKRSLTQDQSLLKKRYGSMMLLENKKMDIVHKINSSQSNFRQRVSVKPVHGQNVVLVHQQNQTNREDKRQKNKGYQLQRKMEVINQLNPEIKWKKKSYAEQMNEIKNRDKNQLAFDKSEQNQGGQKKIIQPIQNISENKKEQLAQLSEDSQITLNFEQNIKPTQVVKYLRTRIFNNSPEVSFEQIQSIAKKILAEKQLITLIRVQCRNMKVAWLAVKFIEKDNTMRRSVYILYVRKFVRMSGFQRKLLDNFVAHGYGLIRNQQRILYQVQLLDVVLRPLVRIKYKVNPTVQKSQIKELMKKYQVLAQSRILKYHSYSKTSKYHNYCQHDKSYCMIGYNFLELSRISIDKNHYVQSKADKISKIGQNMYRVSCSVNDTDLIVANTLTDILNLQKQTEIEKDSSFDSKCETKYQYFGIRQGKVMRKYMNDGNDAVICQFVTVNGSIPEVRSIGMVRDQIKQTVLLLDPPFYMAIMTRETGQAKTLAVLEFQ